MKNYLAIGLGILIMNSSAFAAATGYTDEQAEALVVRSANAFLGRNAPDFGGRVFTPCDSSLDGDAYTVTCSGVGNATVGGDGSTKFSFKCVGQFAQGEDGLFFPLSRVRCN